MTPQSWVATAASAVVAFAVAWMGGRSTRHVAQIEGATPAYSALDARCTKLEESVKALWARIETLEAEKSTDRAHIIDVHHWDYTGRQGRIPTPPAWYRLLHSPHEES